MKTHLTIALHRNITQEIVQIINRLLPLKSCRVGATQTVDYGSCERYNNALSLLLRCTRLAV